MVSMAGNPANAHRGDISAVIAGVERGIEKAIVRAYAARGKHIPAEGTIEVRVFGPAPIGPDGVGMRVGITSSDPSDVNFIEIVRLVMSYGDTTRTDAIRRLVPSYGKDSAEDGSMVPSTGSWKLLGIRTSSGTPNEHCGLYFERTMRLVQW